MELVLYGGQEEPYRDLQLGRTDAVLLDSVIAARYGLTKPDLALADPDVARGSYVIAVRKDEADLRDALDRALTQLESSGELSRIFARYGLPAQPAPRASDAPASTPEPQARFDEGQLALFLRGAIVTLLVSLSSMALAVPLGLVLALLRLYGNRLARGAAHGYIEAFRGTPVLLQLYLLYYGLAPIVHLSALSAAILGLGLNYAAYEAEVHRAAIAAIPASQTEAAAALGMSRLQGLRLVLLPQALRTALPAMTNDLISLLKDSSLVSVITVVELTKQMTITAVDVRSWALPGITCAALYFAMSYPLARVAARLEAKLFQTESLELQGAPA
ncbi:MAG: ABC transporter permease subunit, partial [Deltaproteobacteria bacterium]